MILPSVLMMVHSNSRPSYLTDDDDGDDDDYCSKVLYSHQY